MRRANVVKTGLSVPFMFGGVEESLFVLNGGIFAMFVFALAQYWYVPIAIILHFVLRGVSRRDHLAGKIYMRYARQADVYSPWPGRAQARGFRPAGFAREERFM